MEDKINIAELLKDCPQGMELDCTVFENLTFEEIDEVNSRILCNIQENNGKLGISFNKFGCYSELNQAKCVIFPKGKTTWDDFEPPCKFKDGDILSIDDTVYIYNGVENTLNHFAHVIADSKGLFAVDSSTKKYSARFATEEEKEMLFKSIEEHGYKWHPDTKCLVKLFKPNFKVGDTIRNKTDRWLGERTIKSYVEGIGYFTTINDWVRINEQDNWELVINKHIFKVNNIITNGKTTVKIISVLKDRYIVEENKDNCGILTFSTQHYWKLVPSFKVGDKIIKKNGISVPIEISSVGDEYYCYNTKNGVYLLPIKDQDDWVLVEKNKFDISILKPFETKVLVRDGLNDIWRPAIFGTYTFPQREEDLPFIVVGGSCYENCIPYEGNEHLLGTYTDCDEQYKNWKEWKE